MIWNTKKQRLHLKQREPDFPGMNMKKTKRIYTVIQEETCFSNEHFTIYDRKSLWKNHEAKRIQ